MRTNAPFIAAIALSLAAHLWWLSRANFFESTPVPAAAPISYQVSLTSVSRRSPPRIQPELNPVVAQPLAPVARPVRTAQPQHQAVSSELPPPKLQQTPGQMLAMLREQDGAGGKVFTAKPCSVLEAASQVRECAPQRVLDDARSQFYAQLFRNSFAAKLEDNASLSADLDLMQRLLQQASLLAAQQPSDAVQAALVKDQRDAVRAEIFYLDRKLAEFNLLKLVALAKPRP